MITFIKRIYLRTFVRNVAVLVSGTMIAQIFTVAISPILSRIYDPAAFGILGVLVATSAPIVAVACLRYNSAIVFTREDDDAAGLFAICVAICLVVTLAATLTVIGARDWLAVQLGTPSAGGYFFAIPVMIFLGGLYTSAAASSNRHQQYRVISNAAVARSSATGVVQMILGVLNLGAIGLILGRILGRVSAVLVLMQDRQTIKDLRAGFEQGPSRLYRICQRHKQFPLYQAPRALLHSVSREFLPIALAVFFGPAVAGFYWFTARLIDMPTTLIGNSVRPVFYQRASTLFWEGRNLLPFWMKTTATLAAIASAPAAILVAFGPYLFEFVFGQQWREAGVYAQWLVLWWASMFIGIPSATLIPVYSLQGIFLVFEIVGISLYMGAIYLAVLADDSRLGVALYSAVGITLNTMLILYILYHIRRRSAVHLHETMRQELRGEGS